MLPDRFRGAWRRVSLAVDHGPALDLADVVWVQAGRAFADIRVPVEAGRGHPPVAFAGETRWEDPCLVWDHHLDLDDGAAEDLPAPPDQSQARAAGARLRLPGAGRWTVLEAAATSVTTVH